MEFLLSYVGVTDIQGTGLTSQAESAWSSANAAVLSGAPVTAMQSLQPMKTSTNSVKPQSHTMDVLAAVHNELSEK